MIPSQSEQNGQKIKKPWSYIQIAHSKNVIKHLTQRRRVERGLLAGESFITIIDKFTTHYVTVVIGS